MKIAVVSPDQSIINILKAKSAFADLIIINIGDMISFQRILDDTIKGFEGLLWKTKSPSLDEVKVLQKITEKNSSMSTMVLSEKNDQNVYNLLKNSVTFLFDITSVNQETECIQKFLQHFCQTDEIENKREIEIYPNIIFNLDLHYIVNHGHVFFLSGKEYEMLLFFIKMKNKFVTTEDLLLAIWDQYTSPETVRQYVYKLRRKLMSKDNKFNLLMHKKNVGYTLINKESEFLVSL